MNAPQTRFAPSISPLSRQGTSISRLQDRDYGARCRSVVLLAGLLAISPLRAGSIFDTIWSGSGSAASNVPWGGTGSTLGEVGFGGGGSVDYAFVFNPGLSLPAGSSVVAGNSLGGLFGDPDPFFDLGTSTSLTPLPPLASGGSTVAIGGSGGEIGYVISFNPAPPLTGTSTTVVVGNRPSGNPDGLGYAAGFHPNPPVTGDSPIPTAVTHATIPKPAAAVQASLPTRVARASARVLEGQLAGVDVSEAGSGYAQPPAVLVVGGDGFGALVEARITAGKITELVVTHPGSGYTRTPNILIASPATSPAVDIARSESGAIHIPQSVVPGRKYRLLSSPNLKTWTPVGEPFTAETGLVSQEFSTARRLQYFRLEEVP